MDINMRFVEFIDALRGLAEPTRLRLVALLAESDLTVTDLVEILGQSQPRLSRHLKLLCEAGLLARAPEGVRAYFPLASGDETGGMVRALPALLPQNDPLCAANAERAVGVDLCGEMLSVARTNLDGPQYRNCVLRRAPAEKLPFPDASFDVVLCHMVLHFLPDPAAAIAEAARVLRPRGRL